MNHVCLFDLPSARRALGRFEIAAVVAAVTNMAEFLDVYHAMFRPALEVRLGIVCLLHDGTH